MKNLTWKMPLKGEFTNCQKILAFIVMLPAVPLVAIVCALFSPGLHLQESVVAMGLMPAILLAGTAGSILAMALSVPGVYKGSPLYIGASLGIFFVHIAGIEVTILGFVTWLLVGMSAGVLSFLRTKAGASTSHIPR
jgi:hypothetical protein